MFSMVSRGLVFGLCACLAGSAAVAQERVHAVSGVIVSVNTKIRMLTVETDDGSGRHFDFVREDATLEFDKAVRADATPADRFGDVKAHAIIYYVGQGEVRTVVAMRSLTGALLSTTTGSVVRLNRHDHVLTIKNRTGAEETFAIGDKTVADTETGVAQGFKFDFRKGESVRVTSSADGNSAKALLIVPVL